MKTLIFCLLIVAAQKPVDVKEPKPLVSAFSVNVDGAKVDGTMTSTVTHVEGVLSIGYEITTSAPQSIVVVAPRKGCVEKVESILPEDTDNPYCRMPQQTPAKFGLQGSGKGSKPVAQTAVILVFDASHKLLGSSKVEVLWPSDRLEVPSGK